MQSEGLQEEYNNPEDRTLKFSVHEMLSLAYAPVEDVPRLFKILKEKSSEDLLPVLQYFEETYDLGKPGRGRKRGQGTLHLFGISIMPPFVVNIKPTMSVKGGIIDFTY